MTARSPRATFNAMKQPVSITKGMSLAVAALWATLTLAPATTQAQLDLGLDAPDSRITMSLLESWSNLFAGREMTFHAAVSAKSSFRGTLQWRFHARDITIAEDSQTITAEAFNPVTVDIVLPVPEMKTGTIAGTTLDVTLIEEDFGEPAAVVTRRLWIFHEHPFRLRADWTQRLAISLYDPLNRTAPKLEAEGIPFTQIHDLDPTLSAIEGLLVVGEGLPFMDYTGVFDALVRLASQGVSSICLAPINGEIAMPGFGDVDLPTPAKVTFRNNDVIHDFDPRLDADYWPRNGDTTAMRLRLSGERGAIFGHVQELGEGWPWVEIGYGPDKGTLILCGFRMIEKWETTPTPRHLLLRMLERLAPREAPEAAPE